MKGAESMRDAPEFTLEVSQSPYLSTSDSAVHAVVSVAALGLPAGEAEAAEVILVDCSGSMDQPPTKLAAARQATAAAIDLLRDGVLFAVVEGTHDARMVYPATARLAVADPDTRAEARAAAGRLVSGGGTAIGSWLRKANELFAPHPAAIRHALLLTDGRNEHETREEFERVLAACEGRFACDARGIGDGWEPRELRRIVSVLRGTADSARRDADLVEDFRTVLRAALGRSVPDVRIRVRTLPGTRILFLKQVFPVQSDLTDLGVDLGDRTWEFGTGAWGPEQRDFQVCLAVDPAGSPTHEDLQIARVQLAVVPAGGQADAVLGRPEPLLVHWTEDLKLVTQVDAKVAHYTGQTELAEAMLAGYDAFAAGDHDGARARWGEAVRLATESGNDDSLRRLRRLVHIVDGAAGLVRVRENLEARDLLSVAVGSGHSTRIRPSDLLAPDPVAVTGADRTCQHCGRVSPPTARRCVLCGHTLEPQG
ncbi:VWA domain-containing protein [Solihabitans fulvus]|uniref:VWA domain-containing protein n=1 Tax=Solihabitans fulvus TaxID=1892852 RepID=A0A5B2WQW0_9PSEU|nr:VWA domain-containing protein [Solihabitans fulvus]KAA2253895.1 VWA domain-containing protein [Solihabitans fulvus]